jgi:hypothetical protein
MASIVITTRRRHRSRGKLQVIVAVRMLSISPRSNVAPASRDRIIAAVLLVALGAHE